VNRLLQSDEDPSTKRWEGGWTFLVNALNVGCCPLEILVAKSTFEGTFSFSQARKGVDIPHQEEKKALFWGLFPHFLTSPLVSKVGKSDLSGHLPAATRGNRVIYCWKMEKYLLSSLLLL
jgi:hypothetical protein